MTYLNDIIGALLLRNNCVIIPSFGGFVANNISAQIDSKNGLIHPPKKAVSFNRQLNTNDGTIIHHLSEQEAIPYDKAKSIVEKEVQEIKAKLQKEQRVSFHNVGFLYINKSGKIAFEQDRFFNLLLSSYGLGDVQFIEESKHEKEQNRPAPTPFIESPFQKIEKEEKEEDSSGDTFLAFHKRQEKKNKVEEQPKPLHSIKTGKGIASKRDEKKADTKEIIHPSSVSTKEIFRKIGKYAVIAALIPVVFYSFWLPMKTDVLQSGIIYKNDFNPFISNDNYLYQPDFIKKLISVDSVSPSTDLSSITQNLNSSSPTFAYPLDEDLFLTVRRKDALSVVTKETKTVYSSSTHHGYHAIAGCFADPSNAKGLIAELKSKGFEAYEVDVKDGLHRISAGFSKKQSKITTIRQQLENANYPSWTLQK